MHSPHVKAYSTIHGLAPPLVAIFGKVFRKLLDNLSCVASNLGLAVVPNNDDLRSFGGHDSRPSLLNKRIWSAVHFCYDLLKKTGSRGSTCRA